MGLKDEQAQPASMQNAAASGAVIVAALVGIYLLSQFFRNALAVIGPDIAREFDLDAAALGWLSSIFFLAFAAAQIPLGMAIDRWGPKPAMLVSAAIMIAATILFATAPDYRQLTIARLLMGLGCCPFLMAPLALYAELFRPEKFSTVTGIHVGGGTFGMLASTAPLAWFAGHYGWRNSFLAAAAFAVLMSICVAIFVHERPEVLERRRARREGFADTMRGVAAATRVKGFWPTFFMQGANYSAFAAVAGLWIGPWLAQIYGFQLDARGRMTLILAIAQITGLFAWGASDRWFRSYRRPVLIGAATSVTLMLAAAAFPIPVGLLPVFMAVFGFCLGNSSPLTAHGKSLFSRELTGRGLTLLNTGTMTGAFAQQFLTGLAIETFGSQIIDGTRVYPPEAFRLVFGLVAIQLALAALFYARVPDRHPARA